MGKHVTGTHIPPHLSLATSVLRTLHLYRGYLSPNPGPEAGGTQGRGCEACPTSLRPCALHHPEAARPLSPTPTPQRTPHCCRPRARPTWLPGLALWLATSFPGPEETEASCSATGICLFHLCFLPGLPVITAGTVPCLKGPPP